MLAGASSQLQRSSAARNHVLGALSWCVLSWLACTVQVLPHDTTKPHNIHPAAALGCGCGRTLSGILYFEFFFEKVVVVVREHVRHTGVRTATTAGFDPPLGGSPHR